MKEEKPPLGIKPRTLVEHQRALELCEAMVRYLKAGRTIPPAWVRELSELRLAQGLLI